MLFKMAEQGARDACAAFGIDFEKVSAGTAPASFLSGVIPGVKRFGQGQLDAAKGLFHNTRGGLGGKFNPNVTGAGWAPPQGFNDELGRSMHRQQAMGNLKTLAPTLAVAGGLGVLNHMSNKKDEQRRMQAGMI